MNDTVAPVSLSEALARIKTSTEQPFRLCEYLADKIADLMLQHDPRADGYLRTIADTYDHAPCSTVKLAIENCFLYHLGTRIFTCSEHRILLKQLPQNLHDILMQQMMASGL